MARPRRQPNVLFQTFVASQLIAAVLQRSMAAHGFAADDFGLYSAIGAFGPITPTALSARTGMPPTTLSSALARLERRGYVQRSPNPDDGRSHLLELTAEGDRAWRERWPALGEALGELEARLGGSLDAVVAAIEELQAAARAVLSADVDATTRSQ